MSQRIEQKRTSGQALIEGALAMTMIAALIIGGALLLLGTGFSVYYKTKIAHAAEAGARFGTETAEWLGAPRPDYSSAQLRSDVTNVVNVALAEMGMPSAAKVEVRKTTVGEIKFLTVKVSVDNLRIFSGGVLPGGISLTDTAASAFGKTTPPAVLGITFSSSGVREGFPNGKGQGMYLPAYGAGSFTPGPGTFPTGRFPYYAASIFDGCGLLAERGFAFQERQEGHIPFTSY